MAAHELTAPQQLENGIAQERDKFSIGFSQLKRPFLITQDQSSTKDRNTGGAMGNESTELGHNAARAMLNAFASVGATHFDVTQTTCDGEKVSFRSKVSLAELTCTLPALLDNAPGRQHNIIVRPHGRSVTFIQLDDLKADHLARVAPAVFLTLETSPGNFQAWVAMPMGDDKDFARRLRKGTGADPTASGATRVAGSLNFKDKYAPNFPRVAIHQANLGRRATVAELEGRGLVAAAEIVEVASPPLPSRRPGPDRRKWPSYARSVQGAPLNHDETGPDISKADFVWCMTAITWGWSVDETAERLIEESTKARENGKTYATLTARNAALAVERRRQQPKRHRTEQFGRG